MNTNNLNPQQRQAVESTARTLVVLAGPGAGKTKTLAARVRHLLATGVAPAAIVVITFTNEAARELTRRLDGVRLWYCGTLHGFCLRLLQQHGALVGYTPGRLTVIDQEQAEASLDRIAKAHRYKGAKCVLLEAVAAGPIWQGGHLTPAELAAADYYQQLRTAGMVDYDGILHYALAILRQGVPHGTWPFTHLLVDESQDSGDLDFMLYEAMPCQEKYWCGDYDQSIYAFRGGNPQHLLEAAKRAEQEGEPFSRLVVLETNYRSDCAICAVANRLIEHNTNRVPKHMVPAPTADVGQVEYNPWTPQNAAQEMARLAADLSDKDKLNECAVLLRTNALVAQYAEFLANMGIPVARRERPRRPADWKAARLLLSLLCNPDNDAAAMAFLTEYNSPAVAEAERLAALGNFTTINQNSLHLPQAPTLPAVPQLLSHYGIGIDSQQWIAKYAAELDPGATVADLVVRLAEDEADTVGHGVTVCTIHAAKGREWDCVYLPAFEQAIIPGRNLKEAPATLEEDRRLAFVAVTRARHRLVVSWCRERQSQWQRTPAPAERSQFVAEMGGEA